MEGEAFDTTRMNDPTLWAISYEQLLVETDQQARKAFGPFAYRKKTNARY